MNQQIVTLAGFLLSVSSVAALGQAQQSSSHQAPPPTIRSSAQEVVLDMVFRDKKGKAIRDIRPEEIHISEDGSEQKLASFRLVEGTAGSSNATSAAVPANGSLPLDPMRDVRLVTLVFEGLDPDGKRFFRQALKDILDTAPEQNLYFSILTIDQKLHCIQPFTSDHTALLKSADKSAMWSFVQYSNQSAEVKAELKQTLSQGESELGPSQGGTGPSPAQMQNSVNARMAKIQYDMLEAADAADREYNARATIDALLSLVRAQSELPGRKLVLYFNPWLYISETVKEQYTNLISTANRANVSFYTVDPKGLVTWSQGGAGRDWLRGATGEIRNQQMRGGVGEVSAQQARATETAESALRANPLLWLRDLAQQTGGATIAETNDWKAPLRAAMDEVRTYYEVSYSPHVAVYDGKFRKISVHVDRPNIAVLTRSGYFALPPLKNGQQLNAYEMPLLNALNATGTSADVAFQAAAERFNNHGSKVEYMVTLEAPLRGITFAPREDHKTAAIDAALLAVLKDSRGEIVAKFSKDFAVQVNLDNMDAYKVGNLVQTFRTELSPGEYTLEAVIMDRNSNKVGVKKRTLTVPEPSSKLSLSEVVLVRRTEVLKGDQILDAFYFPGGKVVPTLTDTLKGGTGNVLPFYFAVYPDRSIKDAPQLTMSFYKGGKYLGAAEAPLPAVQQDGRIPYIANLPADKFTPGAYEIHIGITQGSAKAEEKVAFQVE
jgi:VWFA-related protein